MTTQVQDLAKLRSEGKLTDEEMEEDSQKLSDEIDLMREEMLGEEEQIKTDKEAKEGSLFHKSMSWCAPRACAPVLAPALYAGARALRPLHPDFLMPRVFVLYICQPVQCMCCG